MATNINFTGLHIAQCKGLTKKGLSSIIDFYKITKEDDKLINSLLDIKQKDVGSRITSAVSSAKEANDHDVYVAVCENKPIGILDGYASNSHLFDSKYYVIKDIASWGQNKNFFTNKLYNKVLNTGKGLLTLAFKTAESKNLNRIELVARENAYDFYYKNNFVYNPVKNRKSRFLLKTKEMKCELSEDILQKHINEIEMKFYNSPEEQDLSNLDMSFKNSILKDKILEFLHNRNVGCGFNRTKKLLSLGLLLK